MDRFEDRAKDWEKVGHRVRNVDNIANEIHRRVRLEATMEVMDFGSGTGLLLERIAPRVAKITAVDTSPAMNAQLALKRDGLGCELEILEVDLAAESVERRFDGIVSSMTIHHVEDIPSLFGRLHALLKEGGFIAIADLDAEDGRFHDDDAGVYHHGFERDALLRTAQDAGFRGVEIGTASVIRQPRRDYPVFLLTALR